MISGLECKTKIAKEALNFIDLYRLQKTNTIEDAFYHSHLDLFQELTEGFLKSTKEYVYVLKAGTGCYVQVKLTHPTDGVFNIKLVNSLSEASAIDLRSDIFILRQLLSYVKEGMGYKEARLFEVNKYLLDSTSTITLNKVLQEENHVWEL